MGLRSAVGRPRDGEWRDEPRRAGGHRGAGRRRRLFTVVAGCGLAVVVGVAAWAWWPSAPRPHARRYRDVSACLLTGARGLAGPVAGPVWRSMQQASVSTRVMVTHLPAPSASLVPVMLNTLAQRQCGVIVTAGVDAAAVVKTARSDAHQRYLLVSAAVVAAAAPGNVTVVTAGSAPGQISKVLSSLVSGQAGA